MRRPKKCPCRTQDRGAAGPRPGLAISDFLAKEVGLLGRILPICVAVRIEDGQLTVAPKLIKAHVFAVRTHDVGVESASRFAVRNINGEICVHTMGQSSGDNNRSDGG